MPKISYFRFIPFLILLGTLPLPFGCAKLNRTASGSVSTTSTVTLPTLSYTGATGTTGALNVAMSISPTTLTAGSGKPITSCDIKAGSTNASSFPSTLTVNPTTCVISGTPTSVLSSTQFTLVARNAGGSSAEATVTITVDSCNGSGSPFGSSAAGTPADPYHICTATQLANILGVYLASSFQLRVDLNLSSVSNWTPIGTNAARFTGNFDGNSHTISNLTINSPTTDYIGLFGYVESSAATTTIKNLTLSNVSVTGRTNVGALVGQMDSANISFITGISISGSVTGTGSEVGGLGGLTNRAIITYSSSSVTVQGAGGDVGGLVGSRSGGGSMDRNFTTGNVSCTGTLSDCIVGGLVGVSGFGSIIDRNYTTGNVSGAAAIAGSVGGLVGTALAGGGGGAISYSYATGSVTGVSGPANLRVGGLIGYADDTFGAVPLAQVYSTGSVSGAGTLGGLVGVTTAGASATNSFWDMGTSGRASSALGSGLSTANMKIQGSYTTWDFTTVWNAPTASTYPTLR